jgi:hypothetical protein
MSNPLIAGGFGSGLLHRILLDLISSPTPQSSISHIAILTLLITCLIGFTLEAGTAPIRFCFGRNLIWMRICMWGVWHTTCMFVKTLCPSGLRGWTQVPLARAAWVQIPQVSFFMQKTLNALRKWHLSLRIDSNNRNQHLGDCTLRFMSTQYLSQKCQGDLILKNYETNWIKNAETRDRTGDLQIFGLTLSQLSYRGSARIVGLAYAWDCLGAITLDLDRMLTMKPS